MFCKHNLGHARGAHLSRDKELLPPARARYAAAGDRSDHNFNFPFSFAGPIPESSVEAAPPGPPHSNKKQIGEKGESGQRAGRERAKSGQRAGDPAKTLDSPPGEHLVREDLVRGKATDMS